MTRIGLAALGLVFALPLSAAVPTAAELLAQNYAATRHPSATAEIVMTLSNKAGQELVPRRFNSYTKLKADGRDAMHAMYFHAPPELKGTATLLIEKEAGDDDMWVYLPGLRKTRRLMSDNKRDAFVGSDFSYGEILGHRPSDWIAVSSREDVLNGIRVYVVSAQPRSDGVKASSGYSRRELWLDVQTLVALRTDYWDETGSPLKTITVSDVRLVEPLAHRYQYMRALAVNLQTGHRTMLQLENFMTKIPLTDTLFTVQSIERGD